mmetsp:Transcript_7727/g.11059  ORF Transcript_7727/g.11059 Transcript_7727/m.11059 type:complete len:565 (-) Transcript_7727:315-2009(-)
MCKVSSFTSHRKGAAMKRQLSFRSILSTHVLQSGMVVCCLFSFFTMSSFSRSIIEQPHNRRLNVIPDHIKDRLLTVINMPNHLSWAPWYAPNRSAIVPVDYSYAFNPSILELSDGSHIFAARIGWVYFGNCKKYERENDAASLYNCLRTHLHQYGDFSVFGFLHSEGNELEILPPTLLADKGHDNITNPLSWAGGQDWFDTRLVYPFNHRYDPSNNTRNHNILVTSQKTEYITGMDWFELEGSNNLILQSSFIGSVSNPSSWLQEKQAAPVKHNQLKRWVYYDDVAEKQEWKGREDGVSVWNITVADIARVKCKPRPQGYPPLPYNEGDFAPKNLPPSRVDKSHRRLAAIVTENSKVVVDKNWAPFVYKQRTLFSYDLEPHHVICENDVNPEDDDIDCVFCIPKHRSNSSDVLSPFKAEMLSRGFNESRVHLNGAPAYHIEALNSFLGIMHVVNVKKYIDPAGLPKQTRAYEHFFYLTEAEPPFKLTRVAKHKIPLQSSRCISPWFGASDTVEVNFATYMQFHPDRPGAEIVISYGEGDRHPRISTFGMDEVLDLLALSSSAVL